MPALHELEAFRALAERGIDRAASGLSEMIGQEVQLELLEIRSVPIELAMDLLGSPEEVVAGVYVGFTGGLCGHVTLILSVPVSLELAALLIGDEPGTVTEIDEMASSALAEVGNIMSSQFVNTLADEFECEIHVTPPAVAIDMAAAILSTIAAEVGMTTDQLIAIRTKFRIADRAVTGEFLVVPDPASLMAIYRRGSA